MQRGVKKWFRLHRNLRREFTLSITFKAIDSRERLSSKIHPRYFTFTCCLISIPFYTIFKNSAFQSLCLVPNKTDNVLSSLNWYLVYCQQTSHTSSKNIWLVAFQFQLQFYVGKLYKYHQHKITSCRQLLEKHHTIGWKDWSNNYQLKSFQ